MQKRSTLHGNLSGALLARERTQQAAKVMKFIYANARN
jgi:hypothetical protein